ncbi:MAG TPA: patatin-like phospholipase family protein [Terracidiphilus sp.]|nr:patatin-like phospholipase family protein [Terracidiphilus sp.]
MSTANSKTVSLVLGSGGARGLAHIGVIHWLEENGFKIKSIVGCSIGAVIGGIYAAGKLDVYEQWVRCLTKVDILTLLDLSWDKSGLVRGDKLVNTLIGLVGEKLIEDLPISFTAVAADLRGQKEVWIRSGSLFDAMRASFAIPLFFTPFKYKGVDLVDVGVLNPVPIAPTSGDQTDITIAVNLNGPPETSAEPAVASAAPQSPPSPLREKLNRFISRLQPSTPGGGSRDWGPYEIAIQGFEAMQSTIARLKLAAYPPDIVIDIPRNVCKTLEFDRAAEIIALGYSKAKNSGLAASAGRR